LGAVWEIDRVVVDTMGVFDGSGGVFVGGRRGPEVGGVGVSGAAVVDLVSPDFRVAMGVILGVLEVFDACRDRPDASCRVPGWVGVRVGVSGAAVVDLVSMGPGAALGVPLGVTGVFDTCGDRPDASSRVPGEGWREVGGGGEGAAGTTLGGAVGAVWDAPGVDDARDMYGGGLDVSRRMPEWVGVDDVAAGVVDTIGLGGPAGVVWVAFDTGGATLGSWGVPAVVPGRGWSVLGVDWRADTILLPGLGILCPASLFPITTRALPTSSCVPLTSAVRVVVDLVSGRAMVTWAWE
jgi:hypothetical protein